MVPSIFIEPFPASTQERLEGPPCNVSTASPAEIIAAVQQAGIVGLGGAGFPTHAKMRIPENKYVDTIIINGAECEPYLTADHRVMLEFPDDLLLGTVRHLLKFRFVLGLEVLELFFGGSLFHALGFNFLQAGSLFLSDLPPRGLMPHTCSTPSWSR